MKGLTPTQEGFKEGFSHCTLPVMEREEFCAERQAAVGKLQTTEFDLVRMNFKTVRVAQI